MVAVTAHAVSKKGQKKYYYLTPEFSMNSDLSKGVLRSISVENADDSNEVEAVQSIYSQNVYNAWVQVLGCSCSDNDWPATRPTFCDHIEAVVSQNADAPWVHGHSGDYSVLVPVFPTLGLWATCVVNPVVTAGAQRATVEVRHSDSTLAYVYLALLDESEGRNTLRELILEHIKSEMYQAIAGNPNSRPLFCRASSHGYGEERILSMIKNNTRGFWAEAFSIYVNGACRKCSEYTNTASDVPEL